MNTQDFQHYPTARTLALKAWSKFKNKEFKRVLEPHIAKGDLVRPQLEALRRNHPIKIDCCEIDPQWHPYLSELREQYEYSQFNLVGWDFMAMQSGSIYSHIIMNPPFAVGAEHTLHAWKLLWDGEISSIINAETLRNPYTQARKELLNLIEKYGEVEYIEGAFATDETLRKTNVEVAVVYLCKTANIGSCINNEWIDDLNYSKNDAEKITSSYQADLLPTLPNSTIENMVLTYQLAMEAMKQAVFATEKHNVYAQRLGWTMAQMQGKETDANSSPKGSTSSIRSEIEKGYVELKDRAWANILRSTNVTSKLSSKAQKRLESEFETISKLEFTVANIYGFIEGLLLNQRSIDMEMACDVFDAFMSYDKDNTVFYQTWKSNLRHRRCGMRLRTNRIVHPRHKMWCSSLDYESLRFLDDIDRVFAMLDGKATPEISLRKVFETKLSELRQGERIKSSYFDVRYYQGVGTIHFFPTNKDVLERLNRTVGQHRQWLPPHVNDVSEGFWEQYEKAEKFDTELRKSVETGSRYYHRSAISTFVHSRDQNDKEHAENLISASLIEIQVKHNVSVDFQLTNQAQPKQQMLLLDAA